MIGPLLAIAIAKALPALGSIENSRTRLPVRVSSIISLVSAFAESWFAQAAFAYLAQHTVVTVSGTSLHLPEPSGRIIPRVHGFPFGSPVFFSGLLVLALSEVFRQGLALKNENDLTV